jgi:hypothetical protein
MAGTDLDAVVEGLDSQNNNIPIIGGIDPF